MKNLYGPAISVFVMVLITGGCFQEQQETTETICQGASLDAEAVVTFYAAQNGSYITLENHEICMTAGNIEISAAEPTGEVRYRLDGGDFLVKSNQQASDWDMLYAKLILTTMRLGDSGWQFAAEAPENTRIFGENYKKLTISAAGPFSEHYVPWAEITLYAHPQKKLIERVGIKCQKNSTELLAFAYNWRFVEELGLKMPTKIDVLNTENGMVNAKPILQIHYLTLAVKEAAQLVIE